MTADLVARLRAFIREVAPGQCKMMSKGDECTCPLCDVDRLAHSAQQAKQDREDAARWRWLRANPNWVSLDKNVTPAEMMDREADAAIDASQSSAGEAK